MRTRILLALTGLRETIRQESKGLKTPALAVRAEKTKKSER